MSYQDLPISDDFDYLDAELCAFYDALTDHLESEYYDEWLA
jgi:hypothetical protein